MPTSTGLSVRPSPDEAFDPITGGGATATRQVFQLHPNGWKFAEGHVAKLELLPADQPYGRNSNGQVTVTVSNLELRLPVVDEPGCGLVKDPAPKILPAGYTLAPDFESLFDGSRCAACALSSCKLPTKTGKGQLAIKDKPGTAADRTQWIWAAGAATTKTEFGNPGGTSTGYSLCVYDGDGEVVSNARASGGGICDGKPCWKETPRGFKYRKRDISGSGLVNTLQITLKEGAAGKALGGRNRKGWSGPGATAHPTGPCPAREWRRDVLGIELQRPRQQECRGPLQGQERLRTAPRARLPTRARGHVRRSV
ncbi:MAG: hypothetical protein ABIR79_15170 [Candidatus Binatia bacterium]